MKPEPHNFLLQLIIIFSAISSVLFSSSPFFALFFVISQSAVAGKPDFVRNFYSASMDSLRNIANIGKQCLSSDTGFTGKMKTLKRKCDTLHSHEKDIIAQLQHEESSSSKRRKNAVEDWLGNVEKTRNKVESVEVEVSTISGLLGSVTLASRVEDLTKEVDGLMEQGQVFQEQGITLDVHEEVSLLVPKLVGQAFQINLETIWELLRKAGVLKIGVWGMGGVGKTTLIKHIHNRILEDRDTFDHVYWITVSQNPSIPKLQDDIAKEIGFDISSVDNESRRAAILSRELNKRKRSVLILDDVWNDISLESVGIATAVNGCKLLITTRSLDVCRRQCCQEKIKIESLSEEEAWYLFEKTLGHPKMVLSTEVLDVAKCVAQECAGLPLGIITLASSMREVNDVCEWRNVLQELQESEVVLIEAEMEEKIFNVLKFSYNYLKDEIVQKCFLYCALYPEDHSIEREELIQYLIDEGLIGKMRNRQAQCDRGHAILNKLVNSCLLETVDVDLENPPLGVKMHDLVRDMAIKITGHQFMVKAGMKLEEIPEEQEWSKDVERVSLMGNSIKEIASSTSPMCPKLKTLFLSRSYSLERIENSFFEHMPALQVLNLSWCRDIEELPSSVSNLKNLSALVLCGCLKLQHMPSLAEVTSLKRLDLKDSGILEVPHGLEKLVNLTYLDLSGTKNLRVFPSGILPKLSQLEYLKFDLYREVKVKGEELRGLEKLKTFEGRLKFDDKVNGFKEYVKSRRKYVGTNCSYEFCFDDGNKYVYESYNREHNLNEVELRHWRMSGRREEDANVETLEALLKDVQSLEMKYCEVAGSLSDARWLVNATQDLKRCLLLDCSGIECVGGGPPSLPVAVFSSLKILDILFCSDLKVLFQPGFLPNLQNLEEIYVCGCDGLEEIIASTTTTTKEEEESASSSNNYNSYHSCSDVQYSLPKLNTLTLDTLPKLKSICEGTLACDALEVFYVTKCPLLQRIPLSKPPSSLKLIDIGIFNGSKWWKSLKWDDPDAKNLFEPYLS